MPVWTNHHQLPHHYRWGSLPPIKCQIKRHQKLSTPDNSEVPVGVFEHGELIPLFRSPGCSAHAVPLEALKGKAAKHVVDWSAERAETVYEQWVNSAL